MAQFLKTYAWLPVGNQKIIYHGLNKQSTRVVFLLNEIIRVVIPLIGQLNKLKIYEKTGKPGLRDFRFRAVQYDHCRNKAVIIINQDVHEDVIAIWCIKYMYHWN